MALDEDLGQEWARLLFGPPIPVDEPVSCHLAHRLIRPDYELSQWRLAVGAPAWLSWSLRMISPSLQDVLSGGELWRGSKRILVSPDACWPHIVNLEAAQTCLAHGVALAWFDRLDFAHDSPNAGRKGAFYERFPDASNGCLSVWAWGLSLTAHALREKYPDAKVGVIGHSRGGKAALLGAAQDHRIDAVIANNSGSGGAASLAVVGSGAESLPELASTFPHWLGAQAGNAAVQERLREIDSMSFWARIAPRPLLILQAQQDAWANPMGTRYAYETLKAHWTNKNSLALVEREGEHAMQPSDWYQAALFMRVRHDHWE